MLNYMKSEFYRVLHSAVVYVTAVILGVLTIILNVMLAGFNRFSTDFLYGTTSFSFSNLVANPMVYCYMAFIIVAILYEANKRNGDLKNTIAYGISRTKIFAGKCIVSFITSLVILMIVMTVYIVSAVLLLKHSGPTEIEDLLLEIPAVSLIAISSLILGVVVLELFNKSVIAMVVWYLIFAGIPTALFCIGIKVEFIQKIALWMPENFFRVEMQVNMAQCTTIWDTAEGMAKCLISGAIGIVLFSIAGILLLRKKEI